MSLKKAADFFLLFVLLFFTQRIALAQSQENNGYSADDAILVDSLNARALAFRYLDLDSLSFFAKKSYKLAEKNNYISGKVIAARLIAVELMYKGQFSEGIDLLFKEKLDLDTVNYIRENAIIDYNLGLIYSASGNYKAGLPYLNKSLARFRDLQDEDNLFQCLNNIGVCYIRLNEFDKALEIFKEIDRKYTEPSAGLITTLMVNYGYCYYGLEKYDSAKLVLNEFFSMPKDSIDERGYGFAHFKLGEVYVKENNPKEAIKSFESSIAIFDKFKTHPDKVEAYNGLAELYLSQRNYTNAIRNANDAYRIALESGILPFQKTSLETRYQILKAQGKFEEALRVFEDYKSVSDSLVETQQSAEMGRITAQYEFNQQRNRLLLIQKQTELENQEILSQQQLTIQIAIVVILSIIILLVVIYRGYSVKLKNNRLLQEKNTEIERQRDKLDNTNKVKNKLLSIIGHDLKSPLSSLNGLLYMIKNKIAKKEDLETILPKLIDNFDTTSNLLNNLLNWTQSQMEGYTLEFTSFDIHQVILEVVDNAKFRLDDKNITCHIDGESVWVHAEKNMIEIVSQNLIANAIKFSEPGSSINIKIEVSNEVCLSFSDSGVGLSQERIDYLLDTSNFSSTMGTKNERGSGLGLTICKDFLKKNNSQLSISSKLNAGSTFSFCLNPATTEK